MRGSFTFGGNNALVQLLNYGSKGVAPLAIGLFGSAGAAGLYDRAGQAVLVPMNEINAPATDVALPILSRLQDETDTFMASSEARPGRARDFGPG